MANAGYHISDSTIANVLNAHRIEPAPDRQRSHSWSTSLKAHWHSIFATDFTTVEVWTLNGLVTCYVLTVMHLKTRLVHIAGTTPNPNARCMKQVCRNITDTEDGFMKDVSHFIVNRDTCFITMRQCLEEDTNTKVVLLPPKSSDLNAYMERWFRSQKTECLNRMCIRRLDNKAGGGRISQRGCLWWYPVSVVGCSVPGGGSYLFRLLVVEA